MDNATKHAAIAAMELCNQIDALPDDQAVKVIELLKQRIALSMFNKHASQTGKQVAG